MGTEPLERKLAAILYADVAGYSRLTGEDEEGTHRTLSAYLDAITALIERHTGTVMHFAGDAVLAEFASVLNALRCGVNIQRDLMARNEKRPEERKLQFRIGINLGDVIVDRDEIYGDGVNIAARLEGLAEPGGICISDVVRQSVEGKLNLTFEDLGEQSVKNIENPVRAYRVLLGFEVAPKSAPVKTTLADMSSQPSIAVLPFDNMSGDPEQEYFSDGITEDLITDLSKIRELFVVARHATFTYKGKRVMPQQVARELGVGHVLEGSVRKAGTRLRITAQLIDAATGGHLWAERYDRNLTDIFALQDEITEKIASALEVKLTEGKQEEAPRRYTENLEAYDCFLRGRAYQADATIEENARAREMFERAIELDPSFAGAYALLSYTHYRDWFYQWSDDPQALQRALKLAQKAVALDDSLPLAHTYLAWAQVSRKQYEEAIAEGERAISLDPNFAESYSRLGIILSFAGRPEECVSLVEKAMRLDPHYPPMYLFYLGHAYFAMGKYEEAIAALKRSLTRTPDLIACNLFLAVIYGELGRKEEAQAQVAEVLRISPRVSVEGQRSRMPFKDQAVLERFIDGLRKAGLPE